MTFRPPSRSASEYSPLASTTRPQAEPTSSSKPFFSRIRHSLKNIAFNFSITNGWHRTKKAFGHERWRIFARCSIHIPPISISVALLVLNISTIYYEDPGTRHQNLQFNGLQFAAKLHEILVAASLSAVAISYIQYELLRAGGGGLSLGGVLAGFQITNLNSVFSPGLWSKSLTKGFRVRRLLFALVVVILMIMVAVVGPSSAILILPAIGWWPAPYQIPNTWGHPKTIQLQKFFASAAEPLLWPTHITLNNFMPSDCKFINTSTPGHCPAGGFSNILAQATESSNLPTNISIPTVSNGPEVVQVYNRVLEGIHIRCSSGWGIDDCFISGTPASSVSNMLQTAAAYYKWNEPASQSTKYGLSLPNGTSFFGPQAVSICSHAQIKVDTKSDPTSINLDRQITFPIIGKTQGWSTDSHTFFPFWNQSDWEAARWIDPPFLGNNTPSISAAFISVKGSPDDHLTWILSCSVYASWVPQETYLKPSTGPYIYSSSIVTTETKDTFDRNHVSGTHIKLDADWANLALPPNATIIPLCPKLDRFSQHPFLLQGSGFGSAISVVVTDAISRVGNDVVLTGMPATNQEYYYLHNHNGDLSRIKNNPEFDVNNATALTMTILRNGYSYSMNGVTRWIAAAILLLHALIALVHTTLVVGFGWKSSTLRSLSDLFLLAVNSPPVEAPPPTASLTKSRRDGYTVKICETSNSQLHIVPDGQEKSADVLLQGMTDSENRRRVSNRGLRL